jgi:hypothetical protein
MKGEENKSKAGPRLNDVPTHSACLDSRRLFRTLSLGTGHEVFYLAPNNQTRELLRGPHERHCLHQPGINSHQVSYSYSVLNQWLLYICTFGYGSLIFRLIKLYPPDQAAEEDLRCRIPVFWTSLMSPVESQALSYACGDGAQPHKVFAGGKDLRIAESWCNVQRGKDGNL